MIVTRLHLLIGLFKHTKNRSFFGLSSFSTSPEIWGGEFSKKNKY
jgi:hypothetical protein